MKLQFDSTLGYQHDAVSAIADLFSGQPIADSSFSVSLSGGGADTLALTELGIGNRLLLDDAALLANLQAIQERNEIAKSAALDGRHFSVEMETGTGKTYVYLRTIFELNKHYGFSKFIVVVPTVPIREGVLKSIDIMREHFFAIYGTRFERVLYQSKDAPALVGAFARATSMQILVMTLDAFNKDANVLNQERERGRAIDSLASTNPVVPSLPD